MLTRHYTESLAALYKPVVLTMYCSHIAAKTKTKYRRKDHANLCMKSDGCKGAT